MSFFRLTDDQSREMANQPEVAMDIQVVRLPPIGQHAIIIGARLAITEDEYSREDPSEISEIMGRERIPTPEGYGRRLVAWTNRLDPCPAISIVSLPAAHLKLIHLGPLGTHFGMPARPSFIYGHLPFHGLCGGSDVFYRYEAYPTSLRIDQALNKTTKRDTYAAPLSERDFTLTGLSAVGRFALPSLAPHSTRWELTPVANTPVHYGASVPLYGQSGGAVEVMFPKPFDNAVAIPNPTQLPIL